MTIRFSMQDGTVEVAQYQKVPIYLHPAFFVTAAILAWPFWHTLSLRGLGLAVLFIAIIFASILLHELAHLEMARRYRVRRSASTSICLAGSCNFGICHTRVDRISPLHSPDQRPTWRSGWLRLRCSRSYRVLRRT